MDLRTGETVWQLESGPPEPLAPLYRDTACEVAVIGGGITGILVAYELAKAGVDCLLLDKRQLGAGSTAASTALLLYELDTPLHELAAQIGESDAAACYHACLQAIGKIERVVEELGGGCDFRRRKSFYLAEHERDVPDLEREREIRRRHGIEVELLRRGELESLFSFSRPAALLSRDAAELDVVKFVRALAKAARAAGLRACGDTRLAELKRSASRFTLRTEAGVEITARSVVFATGYESDKYLGRQVGELKSTYAIATQPLTSFPGWHDRALIWTTDRPYLYLRTTADSRAVIGGEDVEFQDDRLRDALLPEKAAKLETALREMFPEMNFEVACAWTGTFAETKDSLAYIGQPPDHPGLFFALGYGGNGISYSMVAAEIIREACLRREHPHARLFRFDR